MSNQILYINLARRTDRKQNIIDQLKKEELSYKSSRVDAVDGNTLDIMNVPSYLITDKGKSDAIYGNAVYVPLTKGAVGCALSHLKAFGVIINNKLDYALILEDDAVLSDDFAKKLDILIKNLPDDDGGFDVLFLGYHPSSELGYKVNEFLAKPVKLYGLFGYVVSFKGAKKLINVFPISLQIDSEIPLHFNTMNAYVVLPEYRIVFSDTSSVTSKFGTDIQIRESMSCSSCSGSKSNTISSYTLVIFLIILACLMIFLYVPSFSVVPILSP